MLTALAFLLQAAVAPQPALTVAAPSSAVLASGTEVPFATLRELNTKYNRVGDRFELRTSDDVRVADQIVIPRGSRGVGEISMLTRKGAFGKSGKMDVRLLYVDVHSRRVRLTGLSNERGKGGTAGTVAAAVAVGVFSFLVTGKSAVIPAGAQLFGYVDEEVPLVFGAPAATTAPLVIPVATPATASAATK